MIAINTNPYIQKLGRELVRGSFNALILRFLGFLMGYLFTLLVARNSGATVLGNFILSLILLDFIGIINSFGFEVVIASLTAEYKAQSKDQQILPLYTRIISFIVVIGVVVTVLVYFLAAPISSLVFKKPELANYLKIMSFSVLPLSLIRINSQLFRGLKKIILFGILNYIIVYLTATILLFITSLWKDSQLFPAYVFTAASIIAVSLSIIPLIKEYKELNLSQPGTNIALSEITAKSAPLLFSDMIAFLKQWGGMIIMGFYLANNLLGIYSIITKLASIAGFFFVAINAACLPEMAGYYSNKNWHKIQEVLKQSAKLMNITVLPAIVMIYAFAPIILKFIGQDFGSISWVLLLLCLSQISELVSGSAGTLLQVVNKQAAYKNIVLIESIILIILCLLLIPPLGINGAAVAFFTGSVIKSILLTGYSKLKLKVTTYYNPFSNGEKSRIEFPA